MVAGSLTFAGRGLLCALGWSLLVTQFCCGKCFSVSLQHTLSFLCMVSAPREARGIACVLTTLSPSLVLFSRAQAPQPPLSPLRSPSLMQPALPWGLDQAPSQSQSPMGVLTGSCHLRQGLHGLCSSLPAADR